MKIEGPVRALGAMSGTSLDGVDAAVVLTDGYRIVEFGETAYRAYSEPEREVLRAALGKWSGPAVDAAAEVVETAHAEVLAGFERVDIVGFHGQTLAHAPEQKRTLQAGSGDVLAEALGVPVVWDFRSSDVALGGQGAPLAPFWHWALARHIGAEAPVAFLNIGGVANITWADPRATSPDLPHALTAFDTGPGNAPIDDLVRARRGVARDTDGRLAAEGRVDEAVLRRFLQDRYFFRMPPKSLDRNAFPGLLESVADLSDADAAATLTEAVAASAALALEHCDPAPVRLYVTGGGRRNPEIMRRLARRVACPVIPVEAAGLDGDMIEAQAFAYLAVRVARGWATTAPDTTGVAAPVGGGRISEPAPG